MTEEIRRVKPAVRQEAETRVHRLKRTHVGYRPEEPFHSLNTGTFSSGRSELWVSKAQETNDFEHLWKKAANRYKYSLSCGRLIESTSLYPQSWRYYLSGQSLAPAKVKYLRAVQRTARYVVNVNVNEPIQLRAWVAYLSATEVVRRCLSRAQYGRRKSSLSLSRKRFTLRPHSLFEKFQLLARRSYD